MTTKLVQRICQLIAMNRAMKPEEVWTIYLKFGSIDKVLEMTDEQK